jgi:DNA-binding transcriptional ArsR family regulator
MAMTGINSDAARAAVDPTTAAACLFHGFSDPNRLAILRRLLTGEHRVVDLTARLGIAQSTVSKHLACLRDCGLVTSRPAGRASVYSVTHPEELSELLRAAERLLVLTDEAVAACATFGAATLVPREAVGG